MCMGEGFHGTTLLVGHHITQHTHFIQQQQQQRRVVDTGDVLSRPDMCCRQQRRVVNRRDVLSLTETCCQPQRRVVNSRDVFVNSRDVLSTAEMFSSTAEMFLSTAETGCRQQRRVVNSRDVWFSTEMCCVVSHLAPPGNSNTFWLFLSSRYAAMGEAFTAPNCSKKGPRGPDQCPG